MPDEKAAHYWSSEQVLSAKEADTVGAPGGAGGGGNELNIKVLEFNESTEDQMFTFFCVCFQYERGVLPGQLVS